MFLVFAIFGGVAGTYAAINELISGGFDAPCYVQVFQHKIHGNDGWGSTDCCGTSQMVVRPNHTFCDFCTKPSYWNDTLNSLYCPNNEA